MPLYIPWLTEGIKKRGVRYLLHHYLGQFFEEKLTLEQLSIDIYEGKGSIKNLALDVNGLNDELDFIPFKFLDGCSIGQISVEVPWSSLATEACKVELEGAKFICRLKTSADGSKTHCTESTLLSRSLMTSSMQMAEDIVTTEDDDEYDSPNSSVYRHKHGQEFTAQKRKDANQMFEGLEMFAQLIDSVLRRTKLTARNTLFQIQPVIHRDKDSRKDRENDGENDNEHDDDDGDFSGNESRPHVHPSSSRVSASPTNVDCDRSSGCNDDSTSNSEESDSTDSSSEGTVEFLIKFFRCEEILDQSRADSDGQAKSTTDNTADDGQFKRPLSAMPETITKLLTLEDVEMRIGGIPVSNLIGKHTIMIKFNGQKSEISIFSGSPLLAVIGHEQLETFFNVFDSSKDNESSPACEKNQRIMSPEDYAKIENQLIESASLRTTVHHMGNLGYVGGNYVSTQGSGRRWVDSGDSYSNFEKQSHSEHFNYHSPNSSSAATCLDGKASEIEPSLDSIEAFSCELKLPGIWLCILRDGEKLPPLIKPYADSINSFQTINKYIEEHIDVPHIRFLALKVALDITISGINVFLGDLDISEHLKHDSINPTLHLLHNDMASSPMNSPRYKALIMNNKEITVDLLTKTRIIFDPTMIDRIVYDYKLFNLDRSSKHKKDLVTNCKQRNNQLDLNLTIRGEQFKVELLCPIPDLTPEARSKVTQLRPQSFLFDFKNIVLTWQSDKLNISAKELLAYVKTQPQQGDNEAIKFIEATQKNNDKIVLILEPYPSNLDTIFPNDVEQALNESSMYDSIYVGQATESRIPTEAFQTKRKVVRASMQDTSSSTAKQESGKVNDCDREKILTPGDRQHLSDYLNQTVMSTRLSLSLHLPICEVEFEDKEQLDLIYNRFGNDFVFWQPRAFIKNDQKLDDLNSRSTEDRKKLDRKGSAFHLEQDNTGKLSYFKQPTEDCSSNDSDQDSEVSFHSLSIEGSSSELYDNEVTCKVIVDELYVKFNHQSCAAALKQEISVENLLLGVVVDVNKKPGTVLSLVGDNLELATDLETVLEGNTFGDKNSIFSLTAEIKRPTKSLKDIKLAIQLANGLFNDFTTETYTRFWQSINVTDEPILGYVAPKIVTELHVDILSTALSLVRDGARPALLSIDELYLTSMVMDQTSQVMIRLVADEVSLYLKRNRQGLDQMKNYICLIDSGLIDLDIKFSQDGRLEFGVINNVITVRACQDSLSALCRLFNVMVKSHDSNKQKQQQGANNSRTANNRNNGDPVNESNQNFQSDNELYSNDEDTNTSFRGANELADQNHEVNQHELNLLEDAMNDYSESLTEKDEQSSSEEQDVLTSSDSDSDSPPVIQQASDLERDTNTCLLDESNHLIGDLFPQPLLPTSEQQKQSQMNQSVESLNSTKKAIDESGFFVIGDDDVGAGIMDKRQQEPVVRRLTDRPITIIENHFKMTKPRTIPEMLASSLERYVLEEMTLVVNLYGGRDFDDEISSDDATNAARSTSTTATTTTPASTTPTTTSNLPSNDDQDAALLDAVSMESGCIRSRTSSLAGNKKLTFNRKHCASDAGNSSIKKKGGSRKKNLSEGSRDLYNHSTTGKGEPRVRFGEGAVNLWESLDLMSSPDFFGARRPSQPPLSSDIKIAGGTWRQTDVCIQLTLTKVKLLYELGGQNSPISWRFMLFIHDIEIKDRIHASDINKMLYEYCTESMPRRNTQILTIKNIATINPSDGCEECDLRVSLKPLRLNIDQDTLIFLIEFFTSFGKSLTKQQSVYTSAGGGGVSGVVVGSNGGKNRSNISGKLDSSSTRGLRSKELGASSPSSSSTPTRADGRSGGDSECTNQSTRLKQQQQQPQQQNNSGKAAQSKGIEIRKGRRNRGVSERSDTSLSFGSYSSTASSSSSSSIASSSGGNGSLPKPSSASSLAVASTSSPPSPSSSSNTNNDTHEYNNRTQGTSLTSITTTTTTHVPVNGGSGGEDGNGSCLPTHCHKDNLSSADQHPIYIKSFTFSPDVPIRLDYHAKHLDFEQGALAGILMGLAHLDHSELVLRRVQAKHGMRGLDRVLLFALNSWMSDIKRNQLPSILSGVGPMHSVIQLFQGMRDLIWMPIDHYRKDRRLVRGLQRGASSFSSSTAMAAINLMNRFISIVQCTAQIAHDIVTPPTFQSPNGHSGSHRHHHHHRHHRDSRLYKLSQVPNSACGSHSSSSSSGYVSNHCGVGSSSSASSLASSGLNQPRNFCEGVAVGFTILKEGFNDTARNVAVGMQAEDVRSAVGELVRQIPSTLLNPIISATEGAQNVLVGIRNQIAPDARREDQEKWKRRIRGK